VDQSAEDLATTQLRNDWRTRWVTTHRRDGRTQAETAVRTVLVVVLDVAVQNANKVLAANDQEVVQALSPDGPNPTLGDGVGVGRPNRRADDLGTGRTPDIVERSGELGVPVADQEPERGSTIIQLNHKRLRACSPRKMVWGESRPEASVRRAILRSKRMWIFLGEKRSAIVRSRGMAEAVDG
jgi:hypothetical protein